MRDQLWYQTLQSRVRYRDWLQSLQKACDWLEMSQGRAAQYRKLVKEFFEEGKRSREHLLSYNESCEIVDLYKQWETPIHHFPGLKQKIKSVSSKGPILREDERPDISSNRARNDAFVFLLAGKLISLGVNVIAVEGIVKQGLSCHTEADLTFEWQGMMIDVQCKRPQTPKKLEPRIKEGLSQLKDRTGIIAVDGSAFIRPPNKLLERDSAEEAKRFLDRRLVEEVKPKVEKYFETNLLGFLLLARAPAMTRVESSPILSVHGNPMHITYRPDCILTWLVISHSSSSNPDVLPSIFNRT